MEIENKETQDELWLQLGKLWGAYPDKNNLRWKKIKTEFKLIKIKSIMETESQIQKGEELKSERIFTENEVLETLQNLLQMPDILIDAIQNEHTEWTPDRLLKLGYLVWYYSNNDRVDFNHSCKY